MAAQCGAFMGHGAAKAEQQMDDLPEQLISIKTCIHLRTCAILSNPATMTGKDKLLFDGVLTRFVQNLVKEKSLENALADGFPLIMSNPVQLGPLKLRADVRVLVIQMAEEVPLIVTHYAMCHGVLALVKLVEDHPKDLANLKKMRRADLGEILMDGRKVCSTQRKLKQWQALPIPFDKIPLTLYHQDLATMVVDAMLADCASDHLHALVDSLDSHCKRVPINALRSHAHAESQKRLPDHVVPLEEDESAQPSIVWISTI